jgi:hypothetical protein
MDSSGNSIFVLQKQQMESTDRYCESYRANNVVVTGKQFKSFVELISRNLSSWIKYIFIIHSPPPGTCHMIQLLPPLITRASGCGGATMPFTALSTLGGPECRRIGEAAAVPP